MSIFHTSSTSVMGSIKVLTINKRPESEQDLLEIVGEARKYFPRGTWEEVVYVGKLRLGHDMEIVASGQSFGALLFRKVIQKIERIENFPCAHESVNLLLGITPDPIVAMYYYFDGKTFRRTLYLIHDYVAEKVGVVSFFRLDDEALTKVTAHGLGHNRGLCHHLEPIDFMYSGLLRTNKLQVDGFCEACLRSLAKAQRGTAAPSFE